MLIADRSYKEARSLLEALRADATAPHQHESVTRLFQRIFDEEDQNNGFSPDPPQQPVDRPRQGKDQSPQPADQPSGIHDLEDFFGKRERPKPAARPKKADAKTKPTPDNKQKKDPKNETTKGFSLDEFNKF